MQTQEPDQAEEPLFEFCSSADFAESGLDAYLREHADADDHALRDGLRAAGLEARCGP